jgi:hypothetical protein
LVREKIMKLIWKILTKKHTWWDEEWPLKPMIGGYGLDKLNIEMEKEINNGES